MKYIICVLFTSCLLVYSFSPLQASEQNTSPAIAVDHQLLDNIFSGSETMHYSISWSGGVKIGDLYVEIRPQAGNDDYAITARVNDYGVFRFFYPVDDTFSSYVKGPWKLPYRYEVVQKEGFGSETRRLTTYDQQNLLVTYQKNEQPEQQFNVAGLVYNEFSSFFITRALRYSEGEEAVVPTFVDAQRHQVKVSVVERERKMTLFGERETIVVQPKMQFKGLYEKDGDTVLWLTDDRCRIPVEINSKIAIGSLTASLVEYSNSGCLEAGQQAGLAKDESTALTRVAVN